MERNPWFRALLVLAVVTLALYLGSQLWEAVRYYSDIIVVFFLAWLVAFVLTPLSRFLERGYGMPRALATSLVYLFLFLNIGVVAVLVVPLAVEQLVQLGQRLPLYVLSIQEWVQAWLLFIQGELEGRGVGVDFTTIYRNSDLPAQVGRLGTGVVSNTITVVGGIASVLTNLTLILVLSFYLVLDGDRIRRRISTLLPDAYEVEVNFFFESVSRTFGGYLRGTIVVSIVYSLGNAVVMGLFGLGYVLLASILAGLLTLIPLFGPVLAMVLPLVLAAATGDVTKILLTIVGLLVLQALVYNVLSPRVMGQSVGMHPLLVFFALLVGLKQAGIVGAIFGVPVIGVIYAMVVYFIQKQSRTEPVPEAAVEAAVSQPKRRPAWPLRWLGRALQFAYGRLRVVAKREVDRYGRRLHPGN